MSMYCWVKMPKLNLVYELCCQKQNYRERSCLRPSLQSTNNWAYKLLKEGVLYSKVAAAKTRTVFLPGPIFWCLSLRRNWRPPPPAPSSASECVPPPLEPKGGRATLAYEWEGGGRHFGRLERKPGIWYTLWSCGNSGVPSPCSRNQLAGLSFFCILHGSDYFHLGGGGDNSSCTVWKRCHCAKQLVFTRHLLFTMWHFILHSNLYIL